MSGYEGYFIVFLLGIVLGMLMNRRDFDRRIR